MTLQSVPTQGCLTAEQGLDRLDAYLNRYGPSHARTVVNDIQYEVETESKMTFRRAAAHCIELAQGGYRHGLIQGRQEAQNQGSAILVTTALVTAAIVAGSILGYLYYTGYWSAG